MSSERVDTSDHVTMHCATPYSLFPSMGSVPAETWTARTLRFDLLLRFSHVAHCVDDDYLISAHMAFPSPYSDGPRTLTLHACDDEGRLLLHERIRQYFAFAHPLQTVIWPALQTTCS